MSQKFETLSIGAENPQNLRWIRIQGKRPGPAVLITAGIHGAEYVGIEAARRIARELNEQNVLGSVTIVALSNPSAFEARVPAVNPCDGKNLNREFPGNASGTLTQQIAAVITEMQRASDFYIDLHGGDLHEKLSPYVYLPGMCDGSVTEKARRACRYVDVPVRVLSQATTGAYNSAAVIGVPSILIERGQGGRWSEAEVALYRKDIASVLEHLGVIEKGALGEVNSERRDQRESPRAVYAGSRHDGLWYPRVEPGDEVKAGQCLGILCDFDGNEIDRVEAEMDATVLYLSGTLFVPSGRDLVAYG